VPNLTTHIFDAVAVRLLVNIQSDVIRMSLRSLRGCFLNQRSLEFSFLYTTCSSLT